MPLPIQKHPVREDLKEEFSYDPAGFLIRKKTGKRMLTVSRSSTRPNSIPRRRISFQGKKYYVSRLIWIYHHGKIRRGLQVDHRDNNGHNDRIENLRLATPRENSLNRKYMPQRRYDLPKGVYYGNGRFFSVLYVGDKKHRLGTFDTVDEAHAAWCIGAKSINPKFWNPGDFGDNL